VALVLPILLIGWVGVALVRKLSRSGHGELGEDT
jgi:hypothetical protein